MNTEKSGQRQGRFAFATLVTNESYVQGAEALIRSLRLSGHDEDVLVLFTPGVSAGALAGLERFGASLLSVAPPETSEAFNTRHSKAQIHSKDPFFAGRKPSFHSPLDNFAKLRIWEQVGYDRIVFLDADIVVIRDISKLFHYPEFSAAPNVYTGLQDFHRLNSGVFVAAPSEATYADMIARLDAPEAYWRRTDQTFLETYYPDWHGLPVFYNMLQYVWFRMPELWRWESVRVVHYQYEKPWEENHPKRAELGPLIDLWHGIMAGDPLDLGALPVPKAA